MSVTKVEVIHPRPDGGFVETPRISALTARAIRYRNAGYPVHLSGPTGCGKTTLALHVASRIGKPVVLINGDEEFNTSSLVGGQLGYRWHKVVDNYISRVYKSEESMSKVWADERLTAAVKHGFTLIYNEFTRSRPEANNVLLSVFEEGILELPRAYGNSHNYIKAHPEFSAILTSNPEEYAGVFRSQDALLDRMITIETGYYDEDTETQITCARSGASREEARKIVRLVRRLRESGFCELAPTLRSSIIIAKTTRDPDGNINGDAFKQVCVDILSPKIGKGKKGDTNPVAVIEKLLNEEGLL
ncbi:MAG: gas vesicle protein GvpN [Thaumarchaeota archaeon]|nr:gas vesicle protein GvpN [Nitrososphaerota archaeon]